MLLPRDLPVESVVGPQVNSALGYQSDWLAANCRCWKRVREDRRSGREERREKREARRRGWEGSSLAFMEFGGGISDMDVSNQTWDFPGLLLKRGEELERQRSGARGNSTESTQAGSGSRIAKAVNQSMGREWTRKKNPMERLRLRLWTRLLLTKVALEGRG